MLLVFPLGTRAIQRDIVRKEEKMQTIKIRPRPPRVRVSITMYADMNRISWWWKVNKVEARFRRKGIRGINIYFLADILFKMCGITHGVHYSRVYPFKPRNVLRWRTINSASTTLVDTD